MTWSPFPSRIFQQQPACTALYVCPSLFPIFSLTLYIERVPEFKQKEFKNKECVAGKAMRQGLQILLTLWPSLATSFKLIEKREAKKEEEDGSERERERKRARGREQRKDTSCSFAFEFASFRFKQCQECKRRGTEEMIIVRVRVREKVKERQ